MCERVCVHASNIFFACGNSNIWHVIVDVVVVDITLSAAIENIKGLDSYIQKYVQTCKLYIDKTV